MAGRDKPLQMLFALLVSDDFGLGHARICSYKIGDLRELCDSVGRIKLFKFNSGHKFGAARVVGSEEVHLAVMEGAAQREAHVVGRTTLHFNGVLHCPLQRLHRALESDFGRNHEVLRHIEKLRKNHALKLGLGLLAIELTDILAGVLRGEHDLLRRAAAPLFDRVAVANHFNMRAVFLLAHTGIARAENFAYGRVKLVDIGRPEKNSGKAALGDTIEITLRRLTLHLLGLVIFAKMALNGVSDHIRLVG